MTVREGDRVRVAAQRHVRGAAEGRQTFDRRLQHRAARSRRERGVVVVLPFLNAQLEGAAGRIDAERAGGDVRERDVKYRKPVSFGARPELAVPGSFAVKEEARDRRLGGSRA